MEPQSVENELRQHKIKEGMVYQRTKFLQEWQERWMVITFNYIYIFANKTLKEVTDCYDLKDVTSYKSFVRKEHDMIPAGFKITYLGSSLFQSPHQIVLSAQPKKVTNQFVFKWYPPLR